MLPALLIAETPSRLVLEGGTHNQWAPPFDFLQRAYLPLVNRMGPRVTATLERPGFYPAGGGRFTVVVEPCPVLTGFDLLERGSLQSRSACAYVSNLPRHIGEREVKVIVRKLKWDPSFGRVEEVEAHGLGNVVFAKLQYEHVAEVFTAFGRLGVKAERVADEVVREAGEYLQTDAPVGPHLADQLLLPLGISAWQARFDNLRRGGSFRTLPLTPHSVTHIDVLRQFLDIDIRVENTADDKTCLVSLSPGGGGSAAS